MHNQNIASDNHQRCHLTSVATAIIPDSAYEPLPHPLSPSAAAFLLARREDSVHLL
jgi:hypothetical protein